MVAVLKSTPLIRSMVKQDLPEIMELEMDSYPFPWSNGIFSDCLRVGYECEVMELDELVCGYAVFSVAVDECHILNLCISKQYRGHGLGRQLLQYIIGKSQVLGAKFIYLEVRPSNHVAINLYTSFGFEEIARRREYYPSLEGREDAIMLARSID